VKGEGRDKREGTVRAARLLLRLMEEIHQTAPRSPGLEQP